MLSVTLALILMGLLTPLTLACRLLPDPAFPALRSSLDLQITDVKRDADHVVVSFRLTNRGRTVAKACLGPSRSVSYKGGSIGTAFHWIDHPGCMREFDIRPGNAMSWVETIEVALPPGHVDVDVKVEIVNPRRCDGWGCVSFALKSNEFAID